MDQSKYRTAFNSVKFSENFERDTIRLLQNASECGKHMEVKKLMKQKPLKIAIAAAILIIVLTGSAFAISALLSPSDVAAKAGDTKLSEVFKSEGATDINQTEQTGLYDITLQGIVSGKGLSAYYDEAQPDKSYIVASVAKTDGTAIIKCEEVDVTFTPLVSGYKPWQINAWTLSGGMQAFVYEGVYYVIFECANLEIFADHTVYLAAFKGDSPSNDIFSISDSGEISFAKGYNDIMAMFTIPFDTKNANPEAVNQLLQSIGIGS